MLYTIFKILFLAGLLGMFVEITNGIFGKDE